MVNKSLKLRRAWTLNTVEGLGGGDRSRSQTGEEEEEEGGREKTDESQVRKERNQLQKRRRRRMGKAHE